MKLRLTALTIALLGVWASPSQAAITCSILTAAGDNLDRTSYTSAAISPTADALVLAAVWSRLGGGAPAPIVTQGTGGNLTFDQINTQTYNTVASPAERVTTLRAMSASPGNGTVIFDFGATPQGGAGWAILQCTGVRATGTNGSEAIVQIKSTAASAQPGSYSVTLDAFEDAANGAVAVFNINLSLLDFTPGAGWSELSDAGTPSSPPQRQLSQWRSTNDTTADATWTGTAEAAGVALEIRDASVTPGGGGGGGGGAGGCGAGNLLGLVC